MTLEELKTAFGVTEGIFYHVKGNKSEIEMLTDADQSIGTVADASGIYIKVESEFTHADYTRVE